MPWPLAPGPAFRFHYFQPSAVSRQQQAAGGSSNRQQAATGSSSNNQKKEEYLIFEMYWDIKRVHRAGVRRVECKTDINLWQADHTSN